MIRIGVEVGGAARLEKRPRIRVDGAFIFSAAWVDTPVHDRLGMAPGTVLSGPIIIEEMSAKTVLRPGHRARMDNAGNVIITISR